VFTGDEFADGGPHITEVLARNNVKASFFLTGRFYRNKAFKSTVNGLVKAGHYMGAHSDQHLLYADWTKRDSLLVSETKFTKDLNANYKVMAGFGIQKKNAPYFLPPYEWYNQKIADWTANAGLQLINFTSGTRSAADYTYPELGKGYLDSEKIYRSIIEKEQKDGLNGFLLLLHIGTDPRRKDKFYDRLETLITYLKGQGYDLVRVDKLLEG
ncbi:MAG: polysaccharide deacetylase family protein, partial [Chitinophagaceae bacterium]